jgi:hypothetical protein
MIPRWLWRVAAVCLFPLFVVATLIVSPWALSQWLHVRARRFGAWIAEPFLLAVHHSRGWRRVGDLWVKGQKPNRKVRP